jgi:group I intron endonuclease
MADASLARVARTGIYEILNTVNGKRYIGSALNICQRWARHRTQLNRGDHHSHILQRAWVKHGAAAFEFRILEECAKADLIKVEQRFIDELKPRYNICKKAGSALGVKRSKETIERMSGRTVSVETRAKIAASLKGRKLPLEHATRMCAIDANQVREIRRLRSLKFTQPQIVAQLKISLSLVRRVCNRERYTWVDADQPHEVFSRGGYKLSPEVAARRGDSHRGKTLSADHREKIAAAQRGRKHPPEFGAAISARNMGVPRPKSEEHRAKISAALMGHHYNAGIPKTEEHRRKLSEAKRGVPNPKNIGNRGRTGQKKSPEEIAKQAAALKVTWAARKATGLVRNEEAIAKQAASMRAYWANRKADEQIE